jgi:hypothetical protein
MVAHTKPFVTINKMSSEVSVPTANILDVLGELKLCIDEPYQDIEDFSRILRTITTGLHDAKVLKSFHNFVWDTLHLC